MDKSVIEDTLNKFVSYSIIITNDYDLERMRDGDLIKSNYHFIKNLYLEMYSYILDYSLEWFEDDILRDDSPISEKYLNTVIDRGNELIKSIIYTPTN